MVANPFPELAVACFFAVHEDADAVDFGGKPCGEDETEDEQRHGKAELPIGNSEGYAQHHDDGRCEGNHGEPEGDGAVGVAHDAGGNDIGEDEGDGDGEHELLCVGFGIDGGADGCEECAVQ